MRSRLMARCNLWEQFFDCHVTAKAAGDDAATGWLGYVWVTGLARILGFRLMLTDCKLLRIEAAGFEPRTNPTLH